MKALMFTADMRCEPQSVAMPERAEGQALVRVEAVGICGSDLHAWHGMDERRRPPLILGHEICGRVEEGALAGQRVTMNPMVTCGSCRQCLAGRDNLCSDRDMLGMNLPGGFAEFLTVPEACLVPVGDLCPQLAALTEPLAVCLHGVNLLKRHSHSSLIKQNGLIIGAGAIGLLSALLLRYDGLTEITLSEANAGRCETAADLGFATINPGHAALPERRYDFVIDAVGTVITRHQAVASVIDGGLVAHLGLQEALDGFNARLVTLREIIFAGVFTYTHREIQESARLLTDPKAQAILRAEDWSETMELAAGQAGFEAIHNGDASAKIILQPGK